VSDLEDSGDSNIELFDSSLIEDISLTYINPTEVKKPNLERNHEYLMIKRNRRDLLLKQIYGRKASFE
jgi:hypothetical protein